MQITEKKDGIPNHQPLRESTRIIRKCGRSGSQQYLDRGFGKMQNTDFEVLHYQDL